MYTNFFITFAPNITDLRPLWPIHKIITEEHSKKRSRVIVWGWWALTIGLPLLPNNRDTTTKTCGLKMARASMEECEKLECFLDMIDTMEAEDDGNIDLIYENFSEISHSHSRIIWAYRTLVENACDMTKSHLAWKPEIEQAITFYQCWQKLPKWIRNSFIHLFSKTFEPYRNLK